MQREKEEVIMNNQSYLPYGLQLQTPEQIEDMEKKFALYEYYGIPYAMFDEIKTDDIIEKDRMKAILMIMQGIAIPKDLEERLLKYKEGDKNNQSHEI